MSLRSLGGAVLWWIFIEGRGKLALWLYAGLAAYIGLVGIVLAVFGETDHSLVRVALTIAAVGCLKLAWWCGRLAHHTPHWWSRTE